MELVYLWVEDYKNIYHQGFNFSPRFNCKYDEETNELTINENRDYVSIFPDNINITAIVGENGSGKSTLLTGITNNNRLFVKDGVFHSNFQNRSDEKDLLDNKRIIYIDSDLIKINQVKDYWDYSLFNIYDENLYNKVENNTIGSLDFNIDKFRENFFNLVVEYYDVFELNNIFKFNPIRITLSDYLHNNYPKDTHNYLNNLIKKYQKNNLTKEKFLVYIYSNLCMQLDLKMTKIENDILSIEDEIIKKNNKFDFEDINKIFSLLTSFDKTDYSLNNNEFKSIYQEYRKEFLKLIEIGYLNIDLFDSLDRSYFDLSQGERKFFTESLMIYDAISKNEFDDILLVLDEPDISLHPEWQKKYINELLNLFSNFSQKNFHIIITSHSPFILSDIPKENIVFLKEGKQVEVDIETFGANIHTLLSHGFFMENGLIGEFAKSKIDDVLNYLNNKKSEIKDNKEAQSIINIIGEPILKRQLQKMLDSKKLDKLDKLNEIDDIKDEIKRLEQRLTSLWKNSK